MNPAPDPVGKVARATCDTTESDALGRACIATARYETPTKRVTAIAPRTASVAAAFRPCGRLNALTPFAIASTPVRAVEPDENARRRTNSVTAPAPAGSGCGTTAVGHEPTAHRATPVPTSTNIAATNVY